MANPYRPGAGRRPPLLAGRNQILEAFTIVHAVPRSSAKATGAGSSTACGAWGIHPTVPLAQAMVARGHDVLWAAPPDGVEHVERAGIRAVAVGTARLTYPQEVLRRYPDSEEDRNRKPV